MHLDFPFKKRTSLPAIYGKRQDNRTLKLKPERVIITQRLYGLWSEGIFIEDG